MFASIIYVILPSKKKSEFLVAPGEDAQRFTPATLLAPLAELGDEVLFTSFQVTWINIGVIFHTNYMVEDF